MNINSHLVLKDKNMALWEFHLSKDNALVYSVTSEDKESREEGRIDTNVLEFAADIDNNGTLHFAYSKDHKIKYSVLEDAYWSSKTILQFEKHFTIKELSLYFINENMANIFYVLQEDPKKNIGTICHCLWDGEESKVSAISRINLLPGGCKNYQVKVLENGEILLIFISNDGKQVLFRSCMYVNNVFSNIGLLYALRGNSVDFNVKRHGKAFYVLNLSQSNNHNLLEVFTIEPPGKIKTLDKIFQTKSNISDPFLLVDQNILLAFWKVADKAFFSSLTDRTANRWSQPMKLDIPGEVDINVYDNIYRKGKDGYGKRKVLGTHLPDINLILPVKPKRDTKARTKDKNISNIKTQGSCGLSVGMTRKDKPVKDESRGLPTWGNMDWSKEMYQNCANLAHQKIQLEKQQNQLENDKLELQGEIKRLNTLLERKEKSCVDFKNQIKLLKTILDNLETENKRLKINLQAEMNKSILDMIFKKNKP